MQFRISTTTHKSHGLMQFWGLWENLWAYLFQIAFKIMQLPVPIRAFCRHEFTAYRVEILKNSPACTKRAKQEIPARHHRWNTTRLLVLRPTYTIPGNILYKIWCILDVSFLISLKPPKIRKAHSLNWWFHIFFFVSHFWEFFGSYERIFPRHSLMLLWFTDFMKVTNAATRGRFICSQISCLKKKKFPSW